MSSTGAQPKKRHHIWKPVRQNRADTYLLTLISIYGTTVILVRAYLEMTGYPQVGDSTYHIAHLLWGGLLMFVAMVLLLIWANPWLLSLTAVMGGIGAGLFIDEVGKFITKDVNYFYRPAIAIIYVSFVGLFGVIRWLSRSRFSAEEATHRTRVAATGRRRRTQRRTPRPRPQPDADHAHR
jgi:hypothetical protein